jgi:hypothetical protein
MYFVNFMTLFFYILPILETVLCILGIVTLYKHIKNH